ncbi:MAG TPA: hypothetical protein VGG74_10710 [Kofleriaceae bacterium]|jgi:hypothetical protein
MTPCYGNAMAALTDPEAIVVSAASMASRAETDVVQSNISFVNALFGELLVPDEIATDALRSYYVDYLFAQTMNGGFSQFVYNSRWNPRVIDRVRAGLVAMAALGEAAAFEQAARFVDRAGERWRDQFFATDYFGDNPYRDTFDEAVDAGRFERLQATNARWLRAHPRLVVATLDEMAAEVARRGAALPDRAARVAAARAAEPRDLRLIRALCERAGHAFGRRTAASRMSYGDDEVWGYFFITDRGPHYMIDLGARALMFPTVSGRVVDRAAMIVEIEVSEAS